MKKFFTKILFIFAAICMLAAFAACKNGDSSTDGSDNETPATETYTVRFVIDGETVEEQKVAPGENFTKPSVNTAKEGYSFDGWALENGTVIDWNSPLGKAVNSDMTVTALYTIKRYTVRIYANGKEIGAAQKVDYGSNFVLPDAKDIIDSEYLEVVGYRLNGSEQVYTEETLDKTVKGNTRVDAVIGFKSNGQIELSGFKTEFLYLEDYEKGENAEVKIRFQDGGEYVLSDDEYEIVVPDDFGSEIKQYDIEIKLSLLAGGESADDVSEYYTVTVKENKEKFKVLIIGNSYSDDTIAYAYQVAKSAGINENNIEIADLYYGGCTINTHVSFAENNKAEYIFRYFDKDNLTHDVDNITDYGKVTMEYGITYKPWDIIVLQQGSSASGLSSEYSQLPKLISYVKSKATNSKVKFAFNMTWAYAQNSNKKEFSNYGKNQQTMYNGILDAVKSKVLTNNDIAAVIPNGTAVQNARTSFIGDNLTRDDSGHLTKDVGRYIAAMTFITRLTGISVDDIAFKPDGLESVYVTVAKESVKNALNKPFEVTESQFTDKTNAIIGNRKQTAVTFTQGWYDSTLSNGYDLQTGSNYYNKFKATQKFTRETLPVGSLIYVASGWQYRPEGWIDGNKGASRPGNVSTQYIEVTEEWWGSYTERAFNVSTTTSSDISGKTQSDMESVFKIYIPN